ncbi:hypothetical protein [Pantoea cypripedii]|uniref:Uncharacterized protein n=1 Tax=Pantoea cypripedii TaxID=55209 RepID=A0A6B9GBI5_PANCY|nr:hypothetical protein [Pantoea cypripedii]QGY29796.1 hypothetical protein CUN67_13010 [Pantoea cypripedii]
MEGNTEKIVVDVFFQNYGPGDGIPPHWCCKFIRDGWADYEYFDTAEEAYNFAAQHGYTA